MSDLPQDIVASLAKAASPERALFQAKLCNAEPGGYGEGDVFLGVTVPAQRTLAKAYWRLPQKPLIALLQSRVHEHRLTALLILCERYERDEETRKETYDLTLAHLSAANNWDLTDSIGPGVIGAHLMARSRRQLYEFARSSSVWERRLALVSTLPFIRAHQYADTLALTEKLLTDSHDLIQKALGWMLREIGKKDAVVLRSFLRVHAHHMNRTALRYAIEHFSEAERAQWLKASKAAAKAGTVLTPRAVQAPTTHGAIRQRVASGKR